MTFMFGMMTGMALLSGIAWIVGFAVDDNDERKARPEPDSPLYYDPL